MHARKVTHAPSRTVTARMPAPRNGVVDAAEFRRAVRHVLKIGAAEMPDAAVDAFFE